jgi:uncharacterized protein YgfB (UPF0149 family)
MTDQATDYHELDAALERCGSSWNAGQAQGYLCGRLVVSGAAGATLGIAQVLDQVDPRNALHRECEAMLDAMCAQTWRQLVERQSEFELLLPDDQESTAVRAEAMGQWCEGFLHGLVSEKHSEELKKRLSGAPLDDVIKDMLQITRAMASDEEDDEVEEAAYVELVEYLRIAAQLAYEELADFRPATEDVLPRETDTLH